MYSDVTMSGPGQDMRLRARGNDPTDMSAAAKPTEQFHVSEVSPSYWRVTWPKFPELGPEVRLVHCQTNNIRQYVLRSYA